MEPILKYLIAGSASEEVRRAEQMPFTHSGYKSEFIFGKLSKASFPLEFAALHSPCVSEPFVQQVEASDCLVYWREIKSNPSSIRDLVMLICDDTESAAVDTYLNNTSIMDAGDPSFKALIRGYDSITIDIGNKALKVFFMVVDKRANMRNAGRRLTEMLMKSKGTKLPALEVTLASKERGIMFCNSEEEREKQIESLSQSKDLASWNGPIKLEGNSRGRVLNRFATYEIALTWLSAYYVARGWRSHVQNITSPSEFLELDRISRSFARRYTAQHLKKSTIIKGGTFDFVISQQVDKLLSGEDIAIIGTKIDNCRFS